MDYNYNPGQNISEKVKKSSTVSQDQKTLIAAFVYVLPLLSKMDFYKGQWTIGCAQNQFRDFPIVA